MASAPAFTSISQPSAARVSLPPGTNLLGLLAAIDEAPGTRVFLDAADLPRAMQTRTILTILRRRADRRGKRLHLVTPSHVLWRLARLAELDGVAPTEADAELQLAPRAPGLPADALPTVILLPPGEIARGTLAAGDPVTPAPTVEVPKVLGILARGDLTLEPIPGLAADAAKATRVADLPAPKLATLVAWLDVDTRQPATSGGGPGGPDGPDDQAWQPAGGSVGDRLPSPSAVPSKRTAPRLRVVRVGADGEGWASAGDQPGSPEDETEAPTSRRVPVRATRSDAMRERLGARLDRRRLDRERLDRFATRRPARVAGASDGRSTRSVGQFASDLHQRILGTLQTPGRVPARNKAARAAQGAVGVGTSAVLGGVRVALVASWRLVSGIQLSAAARQRVAGGVGVMAVAALFGWYVVPSATVEVIPAVETWSTTVPVIVDPGTRKADQAAGRVPGRWVVKEVTETGQANSTGKRTIPDGRAGGDAVFVNRSDRQVTVSKGTIVTGAGLRFATQADVVVPATTFVGPMRRFGVARTQVLAEAGGTAGNLERQKLSALEGSLAGQMDVQNDQPLRGGTERTITFVSAEDRRKLLETVQKAATEKLATQVKSLAVDSTKEIAVPLGAAGNPVTLPGATGMAVVDASFSKAENDEATSVTLTVKARYAVTVFETAVAQQVAQAGAVTMAAQQRPGHVPTGGAPRALAPEVGAVDGATGQVQVRVRVDASLAPVVSASEVRDAIAGRTPDEARAYLSRMPGVSSYRLETWPAWPWKATLPSLGWRIGVASVPRPTA